MSDCSYTTIHTGGGDLSEHTDEGATRGAINRYRVTQTLGEESSQATTEIFVPDDLSADEIGLVQAGPALVEIRVLTAGTGGTSRTLQRSTSSGFGSFTTIPQLDAFGDPTSDPDETLDLTDGTAGSGTWYYRTALSDGTSTVYSNVLEVEVGAFAGAPAKPTVTVEGTSIDAVIANLSAYANSGGLPLAGVDWEVTFGGDTLFESLPVADPDDPDEPWRDYTRDGLTPPGGSGTIRARYIANLAGEGEPPVYVPGPYSDPAPFTLLEEEDEPEDPPDPEEAIEGEPIFTLSREWPVAQYGARVTLALPSSPPGWQMLNYGFFRGEDQLYAHHWTPVRHRFNIGFGALVPGRTYRIGSVFGTFTGQRSQGRVSLIVVPKALDAPYFDLPPLLNISEPTELTLVEHQHPEIDSDEQILVDGAWPIEVSTDRGQTWTRLTEDARETPYEFDPDGYDPGPIRFRVRTEPEEGDPSPWRLSPPLWVNLPTGRFTRLAGETLTEDRLTFGGSGSWGAEGDPEDRRLRYVGQGQGGFAAIDGIGEPRTFEIAARGMFATGHAGHWMAAFNTEMASRWGVGAYLQASPVSALVARLSGSFGAWGRWYSSLIGEGGSPWWGEGFRYGRGEMRAKITAYHADGNPNLAADVFSALGPNRRQWLGGSAAIFPVPLSPQYTVLARFTLLETGPDGTHRILVQMAFHGPENDTDAGWALEKEITSLVWPCGPPGVSVLAGSSNVVDFDAVACWAIDYGSCAVPAGQPGLDARAFGSPCDPLIGIFWTTETGES